MTLLVVRTAHAEEKAPPYTVGVSGSIMSVGMLAVNAAVGLHMETGAYVDVQGTLGTWPAESGMSETNGYAVQVGVSTVHWGPTGVYGLRGSIGYINTSATIIDEFANGGAGMTYDASISSPSLEAGTFLGGRLSNFLAIELFGSVAWYPSSDRTPFGFTLGLGFVYTGSE